MRKFTPPPTKFGPKAAAQPKPATSSPTCRHHAPPATRFGTVATPAHGPSSAPVQRQVGATVIQAMQGGTPTFTLAGQAAWNRVRKIAGGTPKRDPYDGATFLEWHPNRARINFDAAIYDWILDHAVRDNGRRDGWVNCPYCNFEYPDEMLAIDHIIDWAAYSLTMTTATDLDDALAWHVYVGCNDPANLRPVCKYCNSSKGKRPVTQQWIQERQTLAQQRGGFG